MRISKAWIVAAKDMRIFLRKKYLIYSLVALPLIIGIGLPLVLHLVGAKKQALNGTALLSVMNAFSFFFGIGSAVLPIILASYSLVGEKIEKSLEPLLATPITDSELLLGRVLPLSSRLCVQSISVPSFSWGYPTCGRIISWAIHIFLTGTWD